MGQSWPPMDFSATTPRSATLEIAHFGPENVQDSFSQSALTVEGKVNDFDMTYAGAFMRNTHSIADYGDYSYWYDKYYGSGCLWLTQSGYNYGKAHPDAAASCLSGGALLPPGSYAEPQEFVITHGHYTKWSQELRVNTPQEYPVHGTVGLFAQRQVHEIWEQYTMPGHGGNPYLTNPQGLAPSYSIPGLNGNTIWLTDLERVDRDQAAFAQANWDITSAWPLTGGLRHYQVR